MRTRMVDDIAILNPQGFLDRNNARQVFSMEFFDELECRKLLFDFSDVAYMNINVLLHLDNILGEYGFVFQSIGFCQLHGNFERMVREHEFESPISIYGTQTEALLIMSDRQLEGIQHVLIDSSDSYATTSAAMELRSRGYQVTTTHPEDPDYRERCAKGYDAVVRSLILNIGAGRVPYISRGNVIFLYIQGVLDRNAGEQIDYQFIMENLGIGHRHFALNLARVNHVNANGYNHIKWIANHIRDGGGTLMIVECPANVRQMLGHIDPYIDVVFFERESMALAFARQQHSSPGPGDKRVFSQSRNNIRQLVSSPRCAGYLNSFITGTSATFQQITGRQFAKGKLAIHRQRSQVDALLDSNTLVMIGFHGELSGVLMLVIGQDCASRLLERFMGEPLGEDREQFDDALMELLNITAGRIKETAANAADALNLKITLPRVIPQAELQKGYNYSTAIDIPFANDEYGSFRLLIF